MRYGEKPDTIHTIEETSEKVGVSAAELISDLKGHGGLGYLLLNKGDDEKGDPWPYYVYSEDIEDYLNGEWCEIDVHPSDCPHSDEVHSDAFEGIDTPESLVEAEIGPKDEESEESDALDYSCVSCNRKFFSAQGYTSHSRSQAHRDSYEDAVEVDSEV
jgi:hypothetical protein